MYKCAWINLFLYTLFSFISFFSFFDLQYIVDIRILLFLLCARHNTVIFLKWQKHLLLYSLPNTPLREWLRTGAHGLRYIYMLLFYIVYYIVLKMYKLLCIYVYYFCVLVQFDAIFSYIFQYCHMFAGKWNGKFFPFIRASNHRTLKMMELYCKPLLFSLFLLFELCYISFKTNIQINKQKKVRISLNACLNFILYIKAVQWIL